MFCLTYASSSKYALSAPLEDNEERIRRNKGNTKTVLFRCVYVIMAVAAVALTIILSGPEKRENLRILLPVLTSVYLVNNNILINKNRKKSKSDNK